MEGENPNGLEKYTQVTWNGKVYDSRKDFKMNWLLNANVSEEDEWSATNLGQDHFIKLK